MADLIEFIERYDDRPFQWGQDDCSLWIADWWLANHGQDPASHLRDTYSTARSKNRIIHNSGGLLNLVSGIAETVGAQVATSLRKGDFGVIETHQGAIAAIHKDGVWFARSEDGVAFLADAKVIRAWHI